MKFYVAGKWEDRKNCRKLMDKIQDLGHAISYDWTTGEETDEGYPIVNAINDTRGVQVSDVYVGRFIDKNNYKGALVELGIALGLNKRIFIIGHAIDSCIFCHHPSVRRFENESEFLSYVRQVL
ncbi:hypothetical protein LCGC14_0384910 [marine sediment metagenome]|uniref:Nucleoside 2-deoxyribosyltransferase n=1 Tax=marine sediment metagenome TaxID=412755 RepID=A0A0F9T711_9ZZZZ